jgi:glycosyltransferase involved in cell wall biosynthesis
LNILLLSFYYQPDLSAGSFRAEALVRALRGQLPAGSQIDVVTTLPNRYAGYTQDAQTTEWQEGVSIYRVQLPQHKSGVLDQSLAFLSYAKHALRVSSSDDYDLVVATSGRLMTAVLAAWIAWRKKRPLYLDIRDIFVDTISDVFPRRVTWLAKPVFTWLERRAVLYASRVNLVSQGFSEYFASRYPAQHFSYFTNGIDPEFLAGSPSQSADSAATHRPVRVLYAGNIGEGQGLHMIIPELAARLGTQAHFSVIGGGGRLDVLKDRCRDMALDNVEILPPMKRQALIEAYARADILFLHLNDYEAFKKVLPSKIFEYAATGKPIWAGVAGYARDFLSEEVENACVFSPCNIEEALAAFKGLSLHTVQREAFCLKFSRESLMQAMAQDILQLPGGVTRNGGER